MTITRTIAAAVAAAALTAVPAADGRAVVATKPKPATAAACAAAVRASLPKGWKVSCTGVARTDGNPKTKTVNVSLAAYRFAPAGAVVGAGQWTGRKVPAATWHAVQVECLRIMRSDAPKDWIVKCPVSAGLGTSREKRAYVGVIQWSIDPISTHKWVIGSMRQYR